MADMETRVLVNTLNETGGEYLSVTLGPKGHLCTDEELFGMVNAALQDIQNGNGRDVDLNY